MRILAFVIAVLAPTLAAAAAEPHEAHGGPDPGQWKLLAFTAVNFVIFVLLMYRMAGSPLRDFLVQRRRRLVESMEEAARLKADAGRLKREYEHKAAELDKTRDEIIAEVRAIAAAERERGLAAAEQAAERMRVDAERTARSDLERAREELRAEAARLAEEIAREEVRRRMTEQDHRRLLTEFLSRIEK